jgi:hypothetical protein
MGIVAGGKTQIAANLTSIANGDNIASYLIDAAGNLFTSSLVGSKYHLDTYDAGSKVEDVAHVSGDVLNTYAVRSDTATALGANGDYVPFITDSQGKLWTAASLPSTQDFTKAEDSAVADGQILAMMGAVRNDVAGTQVGADQDAAWLQQNKVGELRVINKAETAVLQQVITVGTTAVALPAAPLAARKNLMIQMLSGGSLYIGSATVTSSGATRGPLLGRGGFVTLDVSDDVDVYGIADAAGKDVAVLEMA